MLVEAYQLPSPGKRECEDAYSTTRETGLFGVMDGVTPVCKYRSSDGHNAAYLAAQHFKAFFESAGGSTDSTQDLKELVIAANAGLWNRMLEAGVNMTRRYEYWSTCVAAVWIKGDAIQYAQLGDSMIVAEYKDGRIEALTHDSVEGIGERAARYRQELRDQQVEMPEEEEFLRDPLLTQFVRSMTNTPQGYSVANGMREAADYIQFGEVSRSEIQGLLLHSDGLYRPGIKSEQVYQQVKEQGLQAYIDHLFEEERQEGRYQDDKTGLLLRF
ncbi:protein phosphatase 2C domain-containing protein [Paenibacillus mendelii]|uniref:Protein phosphatase 2C domain-containing protein n=1 Tax=Paenibacillus mendelii TaxID=206163 RepID=A0ABV6J7U1_9BACL|nr:PP2C family serine/threonine-protein phosphatase [Paenibacillus mendelii]MCQ6561028.1 protein phosphatase 2C family protein [Paenibacillus mendelii]